MNMNKILLITGGATGIGKVISNFFNNTGYTIIIVYSKSKKEAEETLAGLPLKDRDSICIKADITSEKEVRSLYNFVDEKYGKVDTLVNCAGWTKYIGDNEFDLIDKSFFNKILNINLVGTFSTIKEMRPLLLNSTTANIINIASTAGLTGIGSNLAYSASKAGIINMTKSLSRILYPEIRVNCVAPGLTETRLTKDWHDYKQQVIKNSSSGSLVDINHIAQAVYSLAEVDIKANVECIIVES